MRGGAAPRYVLYFRLDQGCDPQKFSPKTAPRPQSRESPRLEMFIVNVTASSARAARAARAPVAQPFRLPAPAPPAAVAPAPRRPDACGLPSARRVGHPSPQGEGDVRRLGRVSGQPRSDAERGHRPARREAPARGDLHFTYFLQKYSCLIENAQLVLPSHSRRTRGSARSPSPKDPLKNRTPAVRPVRKARVSSRQLGRLGRSRSDTVTLTAGGGAVSPVTGDGLG